MTVKAMQDPPRPSELAPAPPHVGIVVVTYNGLHFTRQCLASLRGVTYAERTVVVVENASADGTAAAVRAEFPEVELLAQAENLGFTGGNNIGIRWCLDRGFDAVLLLNNDTRVEPGFLEPMVAHLRDGCIVGPEIRSLEDPARVNDELAYFDWRRGVALPGSRPPKRRDAALPSRITSGCCFLVPRAAFEAVGLLDERFFMYFEEVDFQVRAQLAGFRIVTEPAAVIYHSDEVATGARLSPFRIYYHSRNRLFLMAKHGRLSRRFLGYYFAIRMAHTIRFALRGDRRFIHSMSWGERDYFAGRLGRVDHAY